jgi:SPW repeat
VSAHGSPTHRQLAAPGGTPVHRQLALPGVVVTEWLTVLFGVALFVAPWVLTYTDRVGASWTSWVVGAVAVVLGGITMVSTGNRPHRPAIQH